MIQTIVQNLRQKFERKHEKSVNNSKGIVGLPNSSGHVQQKRLMFENFSSTSSASSKFYPILPVDNNNVSKINFTDGKKEPTKLPVTKPRKPSKSSTKTIFYTPTTKNQLDIYSENKNKSASTKARKESIKSDGKCGMAEQTFPDFNETPVGQIKDNDSLQGHQHAGNLNLTPSEVVNSEGLCIYTSDDSQSNYGSFKKNSQIKPRPKYAKNNGATKKGNEIEIICDYADVNDVFDNGENTESNVVSNRYDDNKIRLRLKKEESDYKSLKRYESILSNAPLYQHTVVNRYVNSRIQEEPSSEYSEQLDQMCRSVNVAQLVNSFNRRDNDNDMDKNLLDSICPMKMRSNAVRERNAKENKSSDQTNVPNSVSEKSNNQENNDFSRAILEMLSSTSELKWSNMEQVKASGILSGLTKKEIEYYESKFEIISSEASYNRSLQVLIDIFYKELSITSNASNENTSSLGNSSSNIIQIQEIFLLKPHQKDHLFSNILKIYKVSSEFLKKLENLFSTDIRMKNVSSIINEFAKKDFDVYVPYLQNQKFQTETYNELKKIPDACKRIEELEAHPDCGFLSLDSFLLLPMQRLCKIKLLIEKVLEKIPPNDELAKLQASRAIEAVKKVISLSSDKKNVMDERQRMLELCSLLQFPTGQATPPFASGQIVVEGTLRRHRKETGTKNWLTSFWITNVSDFQFLLTNQYLIMFKVHKNGDHLVDDFCKLSELSIDLISDCSSPTSKNNSSSGNDKIFEFSPPSSPQMSRNLPPSYKAKLTINKAGSDSPYSYIIQANKSETIQKWFDHIQSNQVIE